MDYSYRDLDIGQYAQKFKKCVQETDTPTNRCRGKIRSEMKHAEDGRFHEMVDTVHRQIRALDPDERELFAKRNPGLTARAKEFGVIEDAQQYRNIETPHDDKIPESRFQWEEK